LTSRSCGRARHGYGKSSQIWARAQVQVPAGTRPICGCASTRYVFNVRHRRSSSGRSTAAFTGQYPVATVVSSAAAMEKRSSFGNEPGANAATTPAAIAIATRGPYSALNILDHQTSAVGAARRAPVITSRRVGGSTGKSAKTMRVAVTRSAAEYSLGRLPCR
jgi:hypothetical protein